MQRILLVASLLWLLSGWAWAQSMPVNEDGVPAWVTQEYWNAARAQVAFDGTTLTLEATGLVPYGLYTFWGVNQQLLGMSENPLGGSPENEFRADGQGNASVEVSSGTRYDMLALAYHADNQTYGEEPGAMGDVTFIHFMGPFPQ